MKCSESYTSISSGQYFKGSGLSGKVIQGTLSLVLNLSWQWHKLPGMSQGAAPIGASMVFLFESFPALWSISSSPLVSTSGEQKDRSDHHLQRDDQHQLWPLP